jgi:hypothetical protein
MCQTALLDQLPTPASPPAEVKSRDVVYDVVV